MRQSHLGTVYLSFSRSVLQLFRQLHDLGDTGGTDWMTLAQQTAGSIYRQLAPQLGDAIGD